MEASENKQLSPLKLNVKRTMIIGFAFFGILLLWEVYDKWCAKFLELLFMEAFNKNDNEQVQYLVGIMMGLDNLAALILMPIFGRLSDKTRTKLGKRMPYILIGTFVCAVAFPFIPVFFHYHQMVGVIITMAIVVCFAMMYRNPAVALMPDLTPKPLRSKANGIINIMGYLGGACAAVAGVFFALTTYLGDDNANWFGRTANIWTIELPFLIASVLMLISAIVLVLTVRENELEAKLADEIAEGEAAIVITHCGDKLTGQMYLHTNAAPHTVCLAAKAETTAQHIVYYKIASQRYAVECHQESSRHIQVVIIPTDAREIVANFSVAKWRAVHRRQVAAHLEAFPKPHRYRGADGAVGTVDEKTRAELDIRGPYLIDGGTDADALPDVCLLRICGGGK